MRKNMTMQSVGNSYKVGDVLYINDEAWVVVNVGGAGHRPTLYLESLTDHVARSAVITIDGETITIAEYLAYLCNRYASSHTLGG